MKDKTVSRRFIFPSVLIILIALLFTLYLIKVSLHYFFEENQAKIAEEAAAAGMGEIRTILTKASSWSMENIRNEIDRLPSIVELQSDGQTIAYTKYIPENNSCYDARIKLTKNTANATSSGYIKKNGKHLWKKTIESFFCQETYKYALLSLGKKGKDNIQIINSSIYHGDMASCQENNGISIDTLEFDPGRKNIRLFVPYFSQLKVNGTSSHLVNVTRILPELIEPYEVSFPTFPPDSELTDQFERGMFETVVRPGKYKKLEFSENAGDVNVSFKPGIYYIGDFYFEKDYQPKTPHKEFKVKLLPGKYEFHIKNCILRRANIILTGKEPVTFYIYNKCELRNMRFNEKGNADQVMIFIARDGKKVDKTLIEEIIGSFIFSDPGSNVVIEYAVINGPVIGNKVKLDHSTLNFSIKLFSMKKLREKAQESTSNSF